MGDKSLISLVSEFADFDRQLVESGGEITPAMEEAFALNGADLRAKVDRYKLYLDHLESQEAYFKGIEDQAKAARKTFSNRREYLRENLKYCMNAIETEELLGEDYRFTLRASKPKLVIENEAEIPDYLMKTVETKVPDKEVILNDLVLGNDIPGVRLEEVFVLRDWVNAGAKAKRVKEAKA